MSDNAYTANYLVTTDAVGNKTVSFFCASSGMLVYKSTPKSFANDEEAVQTAWNEEGKHHFDKCHKCGKYVSSVMYNADVLCCVDCAPWEDLPEYCKNCGEKVREGDVFCHKCGKILMYGELTYGGDDYDN